MENILIIYQDVYPWDVRIEKFAKTLSKKYKVHILSRNNKKMPKFEELQKNIYIHRFSNKIARVLTIPIHLNPFWYYFIENKIKKYKPKKLIVRNLPLAKLAIKLGSKYNVQVIFDNAENYPEYFSVFNKYNKKIIYRFLYKKKYFHNLEKYCVKNSDFVINVIEENTNRLLFLNNNMENIYNVPILDIYNVYEKNNDNIVKICYSGGLESDELRGVSDLVKAMKYLPINYELHIFGDGNDKDMLKNISPNSNRIKFHGKINYNDLRKLLINFDIGIIPHKKSIMTDTTMANKIYEYISYGLAVVSSNADPLKRFTEQNDIGKVYKSGDVEDLAKKILDISKEGYLENSRRKYRHNIYLEKYNWNIEEQKLLKIIDSN